MRHSSKISIDGGTRHVSPQRYYKSAGRLLILFLLQKIPQSNDSANFIRNFNTHESPARNRSFNTQRMRGQRQRQIVLQSGDPRQLNSLGWLERVLRYGRAHVHF